MSRLAYFIAALLTLGALTACHGGTTGTTSAAASILPTAPSAVPPTGQISMRFITPDSGAILAVRDCSNPFYIENCTDSEMTFEVVYAHDVERSVVTAGFYVGDRLCGLAYSQIVRLQAGTRAFFDARLISLSTEDQPLLCGLPAETTRMIVKLWAVQQPASPLLSQEFTHTYTFVEA
jgi:hypothetical protein